MRRPFLPPACLACLAAVAFADGGTVTASCLPSAVLGNVPTYYRVDLPPDREPVYEWAAPVFLTLAVVTGGLWLARSRTFKTGRGRALLWVAAGCLAIAYTAGWVWAHRDGRAVNGFFGSPASLAVGMPIVWAVACIAVLAWGWRKVHPPTLSSEGGRALNPDAVPEKWGTAGACPRCGFSYRWDGRLCAHCVPVEVGASGVLSEGRRPSANDRPRSAEPEARSRAGSK